ncbi:MAG: PilX N-terminal domain-containing pilus assembly protein [Gammaproteobacteria bacterium]
MIFYSHKTRSAQRGVVLVASLLLLIVVTIIALSMFRSFGIGEKIAGNMREKQRALQAAESAQVYAEIWLTNNATGASVNCIGPLNANIGQGQICTNRLDVMGIDVKNPLLWKGIATSFLPTGITSMSIKPIASVLDLANPSYFDTPAFYIADLGTSADPSVPGEIYIVDAYGYGGSSNTVAVVESTYAVYTSSSNRTL